ncbi:MAG: hypothetical protein HY220_01970 [Candidatus Sungbacteria bacterium]|uniref:DUF7282 domain-containing protein n=1 Tax=Candidatus Sungiibacteriota bacterium TaxID=2750080 RepID=A0A9D6LNA8_9BACT|nr:hypothetical protein [Candidatus Sungbacteria bacterium]
MIMMYTNRQFVAGLAIAAVVAGGAGFLAGRYSLRQPVSTNGKTEETQYASSSLDLSSPSISSSSGGGYSIMVDDQKAGDSVVIKSVSMTDNGWAVIHEDKDGKPGNILGALYIGKGTSENKMIDLLRPTVLGVYYAMIHSDNGDHQFDYQVDVPVMQEGHAVMERFVVGELQSQ